MIVFRYLIGEVFKSQLAVFLILITIIISQRFVRVLADAHALHTRAGHVAVGWLVVEDLLTVVALVVLPAVLAVVDRSRFGRFPQDWRSIVHRGR